MNKTLMIIIAVVVIFAGIIMSGYNSLVSMNENVNGKWSQVENQLQRRNDLIPNLVNTVKGYAAHESDVFKAVSDARAKLGGAKTVAETSQANGELSSALSRLLMIAENYPDLKANTNFLQLQDELAGTENRSAVALSLIHISEPTRLGMISYAVFCLKKKPAHSLPRHR